VTDEVSYHICAFMLTIYLPANVLTIVLGRLVASTSTNWLVVAMSLSAKSTTAIDHCDLAVFLDSYA
jgi:hypothetical protein